MDNTNAVAANADAPRFRYTVEGSLAQGFNVIDTTDGRIIDSFDERLDANRVCAQVNRAWHKEGIAQ